MHILRFIKHAQIPPLFQILGQLSRLGMFIPLVAQDGAGARRVLKEWVESQQMWNLNQVVWTNLANVNKNRRTSDAIATSIMRLTFERTFDFLRKLRTRADQWEQLSDEDPTRTYDDKRFLDLNAKVKYHLGKGIRLWIIYRAELLDSQTLEYILEAWKDSNRGFAVILVAKLRHDQQRDDVLVRVIESLEDVKRYKSETLELSRIADELEFDEEIMLELIDDLGADIGPDLDNDWFLDQAWKYTQGHWDSITMFATVLNDKLGVSRVITQDIAQQVFDFLLPKLEL